MIHHRGESAAIAGGVLYLVVLAWAMTNVSFDVWGALIVVPVYGVLGSLALRWMFRGDVLRPAASVLCWGLVLKLVGAMARYWVGFEAYGGGIDAGSYHEFGIAKAGDIWSGERDFFDVIPTGTGTEFVENFTAFVYTFTGGSKLAGFVTFAFIGYFGVAFFVKAAVLAVPGLAVRRYAWLCAVAPSLVYWPSSIGKEALVIFGLGLGTYGIALRLSHRRWFTSLLVIVVGLGFVAFIRPHMSGIWAAAIVASLIVAVVVGARSSKALGQQKKVSRFGLLIVLIIAAVSLAALGSLTVRFLDPGSEDSSSSSFTEILEETQRRTGKLGSTFVPPSISSPANWPYAVVRTLTRPLPIEARGIAQLVSAAELAALMGLYAVSWRRIRRLPKMIFSSPYLAFAVGALFLGGLAYASFANLGVLTRQKSLLFPLMLLPPCLPLGAAALKKKSSSIERSGVRSGEPLVAPVSTLRTPLADEFLGDIWAD